MKQVDISLVMATLGDRPAEIRNFLHSIEEDAALCELIIVDQTGNLRSILDDYSGSVRIDYHEVGFRGLSRARNHGLRYVTGRIIGFPDDDCWFSKGCLSRVISEFNNNEDGVIGRLYDPIVNKEVYRRWPTKRFYYKYSNSHIGSSATMFFRTELLNHYAFDEDFGIGSRWGACEETDLLVRLLESKNRILYSPEIVVNHPWLPTNPTERRAYTYGEGFGAFAKKTQGSASGIRFKLFFIKKLVSAFIKSLFFVVINRKQCLYYHAHFLGLIAGFRKYKRDKN